MAKELIVKEKNMKEVIEFLVENPLISVEQAGNLFGYTRQAINKYMRTNGITRKSFTKLVSENVVKNEQFYKDSLELNYKIKNIIEKRIIFLESVDGEPTLEESQIIGNLSKSLEIIIENTNKANKHHQLSNPMVFNKAKEDVLIKVMEAIGRNENLSEEVGEELISYLTRAMDEK
jgi:hypothetical protein